jgi:hypothetical protein
MKANTWITGLALLFSLNLCASAAQEPVPVEGPTPVELPGQISEAQEEMLELFRDIEENLKTVDILLSDAGAGDTSSLSDVKKAGIGRLLENSRAKSQQVLTDIDRLLEIAEEMGQQSGSPSPGSESGQQSGSPSPGSEGDQPLNQGSQSTQREQTPEGPGESPEGQEPGEGEQPGGEEQGQDQPGSGEQPPEGQGETPTDGQASANQDPQNRDGSDPPSDPTGPGSNAGSAKDRWGDLPVHYQDVFRGEDAGEMPVRYREWIDAYYRRLNERERR